MRTKILTISEGKYFYSIRVTSHATRYRLNHVYRLISDTPVTLIMVTLLASILHLLFEVLAFQSDISFWKSAENTTGMSPVYWLSSLSDERLDDLIASLPTIRRLSADVAYIFYGHSLLPSRQFIRQVDRAIVTLLICEG